MLLVEHTFYGKQSLCAHASSLRARNKDSGRFCTRGRIIRLDELGQTFVVRLVMASQV